MRRNLAVIVKSISLMWLLGFSACTPKSQKEETFFIWEDNEKEQSEMISQQKSEDVNMSVYAEMEKGREVLLKEQEDIEAMMKLTKEEALDLVFEYYTDLTDKMVGLSFFETEDGRIGYKWNWEHVEDRPMFLEETHYFVNSQGDIYLFFEVYSDLYGSKGKRCFIRRTNA